jgi:hypothetical protein
MDKFVSATTLELSQTASATESICETSPNFGKMAVDQAMSKRAKEAKISAAAGCLSSPPHREAV